MHFGETYVISNLDPGLLKGTSKAVECQSSICSFYFFLRAWA